jgi:hypothetical protein
MIELWEMEFNYATGRWEIGTPDAIPYCQFAEFNNEARARLATAAPELLDACLSAKGRIAQLCLTVNTLSMQAGLGRKVRPEDFLDILEKAISKAEGR